MRPGSWSRNPRPSMGTEKGGCMRRLIRRTKHRGRVAGSVLCAGILAVVMAACGSSSPSAAGTASGTSTGGGGGATGSTITIGGTLGLTGAFSQPSAQYKAVYDLWQKQVNANGGLLGHKVKITILNDNSTPTTAAGEYQKLITQDHVDFLLAPYTTYVGAPIVPIARNANKILFNGGFVGVQYFDQDNGWMVGSYTYQEPTYSRGVFDMIKTMPASQRPTKVAVLTSQNPFTVVAQNGYQGKGGALNFAKKAGMTVTFNQEYPATTTDFTPLVQKAESSGAQVLIVLGLPTTSDDIAKTVKQLGWKPAIECMCGSQVTTLPNWPTLGSATNGVLGTDVAWVSQNFPGMKTLQNFATSRGEKVLPNYDLTAYAILQMLQQGVKGANSTTQAKIRTWLLGHQVKTAVGTFKLNSNGTTPFNEIITQTSGATQYAVWPSTLAKHKLVSPLP